MHLSLAWGRLRGVRGAEFIGKKESDTKKETMNVYYIYMYEFIPVVRQEGMNSYI